MRQGFFFALTPKFLLIVFPGLSERKIFIRQFSSASFSMKGTALQTPRPFGPLLVKLINYS